VNFSLIWPEVLIAALGFIILTVDLVLPRSQERRRNVVTGSIAAAGMLAILVFSIFYLRGRVGVLGADLYLADRFALAFKFMFLGAGIAVVLMSIEYVGSRIRHPGEYYALLVFSVLGAVLLAGAGDLLVAYISLELLSFSLYILVAMSRGDRRSAEASTKYILLGALSSALMLYGISMLYGPSGTTSFRGLAGFLFYNFSPTVAVGFALFVAGLGFKLSVVPFHLWAPDVYEGAPTPVTAHISVLSKAAAFALALRFFIEAGSPTHERWALALAVLAALTMAVGTLTALPQRNIKRLMAYSSIAQVGFVLMGIVANTPLATDAVLLHLAGYAFTNLAAFMAIIALEHRTGNEEIAGFAGLAARAPFAAMVLSAALFSLAGLPFFAGFVTKFYLFTATADAGYIWLVVVAVLGSLISLYYYIMVMKQMYMGTAADGKPLAVSRLTFATLLLLFAGIVAIGIYPAPFAEALESATAVFAPFAGR